MNGGCVHPPYLLPWQAARLPGEEGTTKRDVIDYCHGRPFARVCPCATRLKGRNRQHDCQITDCVPVSLYFEQFAQRNCVPPRCIQPSFCARCATATHSRRKSSFPP